MRIFVLTATYELRVSRKSHLRDDHPRAEGGATAAADTSAPSPFPSGAATRGTLLPWRPPPAPPGAPRRGPITVLLILQVCTGTGSPKENIAHQDVPVGLKQTIYRERIA
jgi:hypothetical protein